MAEDAITCYLEGLKGRQLIPTEKKLGAFACLLNIMPKLPRTKPRSLAALY